MSQHNTADPLTLGTQYALGDHKATYQPNTIVAICLIVLLFVLSVSPLFGLFTLLVTPMPVITLLMQLFIIITVIVSLTALGSFFILPAYKNRTLRVFLYEHGLICVGRESHHCIYWHTWKLRRRRSGPLALASRLKHVSGG